MGRGNAGRFLVFGVSGLSSAKRDFVLLVPTEVRKSPIHGCGLFALRAIPKGRVIWRFVEGLDQAIPQAQVAQFPFAVRAFFKTYAVLDGGIYYVDMDNTRFMNHSLNPNIRTGKGKSPMYASRDIPKGAELLCNYRVFDAPSRRGQI